MRILSLLTFLSLVSVSVYSQTGNFRTISGGTWSTATIWERDADQNGSYEESPSSVAPNSLSNIIEIQSGDAVNLSTNETINGDLTIQTAASLTILSSGAPADRLTISASGTLNNVGTLTMAGGLIKRMRVFGTLNNQGSMNGFTSAKLFFESNSIYDHQLTTIAGVIPLANWNSASTCIISGYTSNSTAPSNLGQTFGNFNWNCPNQTFAIDLAGALTTINGNLNLLNTGFTGVFLNQSGSSSTISVAGDLNVEEYFILSETGSNNILDVQGNAILTANFPYLVLSGASGNATLNVGGDITLDNNGSIDMSQAGTGSSVVNISGDLSMSNFSYITTGFGSGSYVVNFNGTAEQVITASVNELFDGQDINILTNAIVSVPNNNFLGTSGALDVANSAELRVGSSAANGAIQASGSAGGIRVTGGQTYNSGCSIVYNGSSAQFIGSGHPSTSGVNTEINNSNGVTLASSVTIGGDLTLTSGNLTVGNNILTIQGSHSGSGSLGVSSTSTLVFSGSGSIGTIPFVSATPSLGTLTINRSGEVAVLEDNITVGTALNLTQGNLDIRDFSLNLTGTISGTGNILSNTSSTINITGSGAVGSLQFDPTFNTIGTITYNRSSGTLTLNGTVNISQALVLTNGALANSANLFMGDDATLTKDSNASFTGDSPETTGGALYNIVYENAGQTTGSEIPDAVTTDALGDITINTSGAVVLDQNLQVNGDVTLNGGSLSIGANTITVLGNWVRNSGSMATYTGQVVFDGTSLINGTNTATFVDVQVASSASLTLPSGNISINGNLQIDPTATFSANGGTVTLGTTSNQNIAAGGASFNNIAVTKASGTVTIASALNLIGRLSFDGASAATVASGGNLTIVSTSDGASGNGSIGAIPSGATVSGNVIVQRFLSGEGRIYRYLSSPVSGVNFEQWRDDFPITGTFSDPSTGTGIVSGNPSLYRYNESLPGLADDGYEAHPASGTLASSNIEVGRGYAAFIREDVASTVVDVTGPVNVANLSDISLNVTFNDDGNGTANEGWNLVGNPFPSSIDWDNILGGGAGTFSNVDNGIQVRDNGSGGVYRTYDGFMGDLTGGVIATGQAFWVRTIASSPSLTLNEQAKTTSTGALYRSEKTIELEVIQISLSDGVDTDNSFVAFREDYSVGYDLGDTPNLNNVIFDITTYGVDNTDLAINYVPYGCSTEVFLNVADVETGSYTLGFSQLESLSSFSKVSLRDNYTGGSIDITLDQEYEFEVDETISESFGKERFVLEFESDLIESDLFVESISEICGGDNGLVTVTSSQLGITYSLNINGSSSTYELVGDGSDLHFEVLPEDLINGSNEIEVIGTREGCDSKTVGEVVTIELSEIDTGNAYSVSEVVCNQDNAYVTFNESQEGVVYSLLLNGEQYGDAITGFGSKISFEILNNDLLESNNISIEASKGACSDALLQTESISKSIINTELEMEAPTSVCDGEMATITLLESEIDVNYQLHLNGTAFGSSVIGNGSTLDFTIPSESISESNIITFTADNTNCQVDLTQMESFTVITINDQLSFTADDNSICSGSNARVNLNSSQSGVSYQLVLNDAPYGEAIVGDGEFLNLEILSDDLNPSNIIGVVASNGSCESNLTETLHIDVINIDESVEFSTLNVCDGEDGEVVVENPQSDVEYQLILNEQEYGTPISTSSGVLLFSLKSDDLVDENSIEIRAERAGCSEYLSQSQLIKKTSINPIITREDNLLKSNYEEGNNWFFEGQLLEGVTESTLEIENDGFYELKVDVNGCSSIVGDLFELEKVTSLGQEFNSRIKMFPNPVVNELYIDANDLTIDKAIVLDSNGKIVHVSKPNHSTFKISLENFVNGIYMLKLQIGNETFTNRFIKL